MDRIAQAESQAAADVQRLAADLATAAARQIIAEQIDDKKAAEMIDQTIQDLPNRLH
jgi:F-type H+-transporting ATPase subunit b